MNYQHIRISQLVEERDEIFPEKQTEKSWEYKPLKKYAWLQRLCFKILSKLGCEKPVSVCLVKEITINLDDVVKAIVENEKNIYYLIKKRPSYILMGIDIFHSFMNKEEVYRMMQFYFPDQYETRLQFEGVRQHGLFRGMKVIVVPYMKGLLVLPDLERI